MEGGIQHPPSRTQEPVGEKRHPLSSWLPLSSPSHTQAHKHTTGTRINPGESHNRRTCLPYPTHPEPAWAHSGPLLLTILTGIRLNELEGVNNKWIRAYKQPPNSILCSAAFLSSLSVWTQGVIHLTIKGAGSVWIETSPDTHIHTHAGHECSLLIPSAPINTDSGKSQQKQQQLKYMFTFCSN